MQYLVLVVENLICICLRCFFNLRLSLFLCPITDFASGSVRKTLDTSECLASVQGHSPRVFIRTVSALFS